MKYIGIWDFILVPFFLALVHYVGSRAVKKNVALHPEYKYYGKALKFKVYSGLMFALVYVFYYGGGDTLSYWRDAKVLSSLITTEPMCYLRIYFGDTDMKWFYCFDLKDNIPLFFIRDQQAYAVTRMTSPFYTLSVDSFFACTILVAWLSFGGVWRLYMAFCEEYPGLRKDLAIAFLFIPSVTFWGSGIMKDNYTFAAACWMTSSVYWLLLRRKDVLKNVLFLIVSAYIMISMKPYIFVALLPGCFVWVVFNRIQQVKNYMLRLLMAPIIVMVGIVVAAGIFSQAATGLGDYGSVDTIVDRAVATQEDLKRDAYKGNSFDIGTIDGSPIGMLRLAPAAIFAGMFRPTLIDVRNPVMLISAIENTFLLIFLIYMLFRVGLWAFFKYILSKPMILFSFVFAFFFSFAVGLTTSNFGSLVRYKIPALPFFLASLYMIRYHKENDGVITVVDPIEVKQEN
ncbi:MAG: hypothetical protein ACPGD8_00035 [Flavobacteriales bacterium]